MAESGEDLTLGQIGMGSLDTEEEIVVDDQGNPIDESPNSEEETTTEEPTEDPSQETEDEGEGVDEETLKEELESFKKEEGEAETEGSEESQGGEETDTEESPSEGGSPDSSPYTSLASALKEEGALQNIDDEKLSEVKDAKSLVDLLHEEFENSKKDYLGNLEGTAKEVAEAIEKGVPLEKFQEKKSEEHYYMNLSEDDIASDEQRQKDIIKDEYLNRGLSEERADRLIENLEHTGGLEEEAKDSLKTLQDQKKQETERLKQETEQKKKEQEEQREKQLKELKEHLDKKDEIIPGVELKGPTKDKVYESMTTPVGKDDQGNPLDAVMQSWLSDPEYPVKLHYIHQLTDGLTDFSKLISQSKKKAISDLEQAVETGGNAAPGKPKGGRPGSKKDWSEILSNQTG